MTKAMHPRRIGVTMMAAALTFTTAAVAFPGAGEHSPRGGKMVMVGDPSGMMLRHLHHGVNRLDLSDSQTAAVDAILEDAKADLAANREAAHDAHAALHEALMADTLDENALAATAKTEGDLLAERIVIAGTAMSRVKAELDEEQRAELKANAEQFRKHVRIRRQEHWDDDSSL